MLSFNDVESDRRYHAVSLAKLLGLKVIDVDGYIKKDSKDAAIVFVATHLVLENGLTLDLESHWTTYDIVVIEDDSNEYFKNNAAGVEHHSHTVLGLWDSHHNELRNILDTTPGWGKD